MTSQQDRYALEEKLRQVLGNRPATTLLAMLPAKEDIATKADVAAMATELRTEMSELRSDLRTEMAELRSDLRTEMVEMRTEMRAELRAIRQEMGLKYATKADLDEMKRSFDTAFHSYVRTFIATQAATVVGVTGIVYALVRLT